MPKIAFLFPGQGRRPSGWAARSTRSCPAARALFDRADEVLGFDLQAVCFDGPAEALEATDVSQPAIFVASLAALEGLKASEPDVVEACEGAAGPEPGRVHRPGLRRRARLRDRPEGRPPPGPGDAGRGRSPRPSGMTSVLGLDEAAVDELCRRVAPHGRLWKANLLGPGNIVVSGETAALDARRADRDRARGRRGSIPLAVAGAFHSPT